MARHRMEKRQKKLPKPFDLGSFFVVCGAGGE